jgi:hypothetical protein
MKTNEAIRSCVTSALATMLLVPAEARAQEPPASPVTVGTRVRVRAPSVAKGRVEGTVVEIDEKSLLIGVSEDRAPLRVPRQAITQLDVNAGKHRRVLKGMIIGAGLGAASFAVLLASTDLGPSTSDYAEAAGLGALGGGILGAGIGALIQTDRWSPVPAERVRLSLGPARGRGMAVSLSVGF